MPDTTPLVQRFCSALPASRIHAGGVQKLGLEQMQQAVVVCHWQAAVRELSACCCWVANVYGSPSVSYRSATVIYSAPTRPCRSQQTTPWLGLAIVDLPDPVECVQLSSSLAKASCHTCCLHGHVAC